MSGYRFSLSCPDCGNEMVERHVQRISATHAGAELWCSACLIVWRLDVGLTALDVIRLVDDPRVRAGEAIGNESLGMFA